VFQDLTNILKLEESLRVSEKLAAVGKLAAAIAHEIRNPLASISGSAQLLGQIENLGAEDKKLLGIIQKESSRLDELISEFLEYVRPQAPKQDRVDLTRLVEELRSSLIVSVKWLALKTNIEVLVLPQASLDCVGDANKITQVLLTLVYNAGQAGASVVRIRLEPNFRLSVSDNGAGISAENQKRLFEPFFTTKERGTGLGLATSYRILEAMGARIEVVSPSSEFEPGRGSLFRISFKGAELSHE
jgi:two-component system sensor histidine kinase PilS (NtrC family)